MIFRQTLLRVADNSGARLVRCLNHPLPAAREGDVVTVSVCRCRPRSKVERGRLYPALVVQTRHSTPRGGGLQVGFRSNRVVLLRRAEGRRTPPTPVGTRLLRPVSALLRRKGWAKLLLLAPFSL